MTQFLALAAVMTALSLSWLLRPARAGRAATAARRRTDTYLVLIVPLATALLYVALGRPDALEATAIDADRALVEQQTTQLAARVDAAPEDDAALRLIARRYEELRRLPEAIATRERLVARHPNDADALVDLSEILSINQGGNYLGPPLAAVRKALAIDPSNQRALAIAADEAARRNDPADAIAYWERLRSLVPADSEVGRSLALNIDDARAAQRARASDAAP